MNNKFAIIAPILFIIACSIFILSTSHDTKLASQSFKIQLLTPTPYKTNTSSTVTTPTPTLIPSPTPYIDPKSYLAISKIYSSTQIQYFKTHNLYSYISSVKFPPLPKVKSNDTQTPVYLVDCKVDNSLAGVTLTPIIDYIPRDNSPILRTLDLLARKNYGGFPTETEITNYEKNSGRDFVHRLSGVNNVILNPDGTLRINFYDSVTAYGGGSSRVACIGYSTLFTAMQYPEVTRLYDCIDKMPAAPDSCPEDFQP